MQASTADQAPSARIAKAGVRKRGWTSASLRKKSPSFDIAKKTRGAVSATLLIELNTEIRMVSAISLADDGFSTAATAAAAIVSEAAARPGPSAARYPRFASRYSPARKITLHVRARGKSFCGFTVSPAQ